MESILTDEIRSFIGRQFDPVVHEVGPTGIRAYARAVGYRDAVYYDEAEAHRQGFPSLVAPVGYLGTPVYNPLARPSNPVRLPDLPVKRRLNGGTELTYFGTVCAGDRIAGTTSIKDIYERPGRTGPMIMIVLKTDFENQRGELVACQETTLIRY